MSDSQVQVQLTANVSGLISGLQAANQAIAQMSKQLSSQLGQAGQAAAASGEAIRKGANEGAGGLTSISRALQDYRREQTQEARSVRFFAAELSGLGLASDGAAGAISRVAILLSQGFGIGLAIEGVKALAEMFVRQREEAKKAAEAAKKWADDVADALRKVARETRDAALPKNTPASFRGLLKAGDEFDDATRGMAEEKARLEKQKTEAAARLAALMSGTGQLSDSDMAEIGALNSAIDAATKRIDEIERKLADNQRIFAAKQGTFRTAVGTEEGDAARERREAAEKAEKAARLQGFEAAAESRGQRESAMNRAFMAEAEAQAEEGRKLEMEETKDRLRAWEQMAERREQREAQVTRAFMGEQQAQADAAQQAAQRAQESWMSAAESMGAALGNAVAGFATGAQSAAAVVAQVARQIVALVAQMAIKSVTAKAADAAAGAAASQSGIPVVGPALAVAAMAAMFAAVSGLVGSIPSAAGGWQVPNDTLAFVHKDEKILPASFSKRLDEFLASGGGGVNVSVSANFLDAAHARSVMPEFERMVVRAVERSRYKGTMG